MSNVALYPSPDGAGESVGWLPLSRSMPPLASAWAEIGVGHAGSPQRPVVPHVAVRGVLIPPNGYRSRGVRAARSTISATVVARRSFAPAPDLAPPFPMLRTIARRYRCRRQAIPDVGRKS